MKKLHLTITKVDWSQWIKFLPLGSIIVSLGILVAVIMFLEQFFYETITAAKIIKVLQNQIALNQIDLSLYQTVIDNVAEKKKFDPSVLANLRDPFHPVPPPSTSAPQ